MHMTIYYNLNAELDELRESLLVLSSQLAMEMKKLAVITGGKVMTPLRYFPSLMQ